jgi:hypothetical protein
MDKIATIIAAVIIMLLLSFLLSWPVYALWNGCLVGAITGVQEITWLQAWGISILFSLLFKSTVNANKD